MRVTSTCVLFACIFDTANTQFSDSDADDLDYASMLAMPSADVLAQLIALSQMNAASSGNKKKKNKNKKTKAPRTTAAPVVTTTEEPTTTTEEATTSTAAATTTTTQ